jgi:hypothetical protein
LLCYALKTFQKAAAQHGFYTKFLHTPFIQVPTEISFKRVVMLMKIEKPELVAYILLIVGLMLLIFTFIMAYLMLIANPNISSALNLSEALGEILGPITEAIIRIMYLGVMGWIGSIATIRGIQLYKESKPTAQQPRAQAVTPKAEEEKKSEKA